WADSCPLRDTLTVRNIVRSSFSLSDTVSDLISNSSWRWPHDWSSRFPNVVNIPVLDINNDLDDVIVWRDVRGVFQHFSVCAFTGMSYVPPRLVDVIAFLIPSKGSLVSNVISRIVLATMTYCLWNERNSGLFKKGRIDCDQIVQMIPLGANESSVAFQDQEDDNPVFPIGFSLMKAKKEDLCRANMFIKMRTANNGNIPDEDTRIVVDRMKEKLNEVPQSEQTDSFKEQVFIDLVGSDGHGSVKTFGGGVSSRKVFGPRSSLMNTTSSHAIERMVQAQVAAQLEAKWFKKLELLLGRELPPPPGYHAYRSGSSAASVISISSDLLDKSVGSSIPQVILSGSISVEVLVALEVGVTAVASHAGVRELDTHSSSEVDPSESSLPLVSVAPMVLPFLCSDDSESDTEIPERHVSPTPHDAMLARWRSRVASRSSSHTTSTPEIPTTPIPPTPSAFVAPSTDIISPVDAPPKICRRRAILIQTRQDIPIGRLYRTHPGGPYHSCSDHSSSGHSTLDHSSSGHPTLSHSLSGHTPPVTTIANSSAPSRFVYPQLVRTLHV
ncbi:hypothetical protein Tco_1260307, partial [Tanacetum coccineum]